MIDRRGVNGLAVSFHKSTVTFRKTQVRNVTEGSFQQSKTMWARVRGETENALQHALRAPGQPVLGPKEISALANEAQKHG